ncbi:AbrB/MazE/SpoVT family DNA-binding domain-containing protein [Candidatus Woesearchaeota archaeon]|nr:AbrB/MazE/SpoVT family DNA-binding domain-containing protein [Candidatus Woesearchaeota archaeon]
MEVVAKIKRWGNSLGVVIPKELTDDIGIHENDQIRLSISRARMSDALRKSFGLCKDEKRPTQEIKDELRRKLWPKNY